MQREGVFREMKLRGHQLRKTIGKKVQQGEG